MDKFSELDVSDYHGLTVIIDIDGTLTCDGEQRVDKKVVAKAGELLKNNDVYLLSNRKNHERNFRMAEQLSVKYLWTDLRKPDKRIASLLPNIREKKTLVIGDKFWTDGRFANAIGAQYVQVRRITCKGDPWYIKLSYFFDDRISRILNR